MRAPSKKTTVAQFILYKNLYQLNPQDKELLIDFLAELWGIEKDDFIDAVNTEIERQQSALKKRENKKKQEELEKKITFPDMGSSSSG